MCGERVVEPQTSSRGIIKERKKNEGKPEKQTKAPRKI
jgi:hypothetical protein